MGQRLDDTSFLYGTNHAFIEELYGRYLNDPNSVDRSWRGFFGGLGDDIRAVLEEARGAPWAPRTPIEPEPDGDGMNGRAVAAAPAKPAAAPVAADAATIRKATQDSVRALMLIRAYRVRGHLIANLDPLGLDGEKLTFTFADLPAPKRKPGKRSSKGKSGGLERVK